MGRYDGIHIEQDFWNDFIVEAFEHIEEIENNAMSLEQNPENMDIIHTMFRAFHTIKGLSGFVEHTAIQEIAHKTETLMDFCRKGELPVTTKIVDAILKSSDYVKQLCNDIEAFKDEALVEQIEKLLVVLEELAKVDQEWVAEEVKTETKVEAKPEPELKPEQEPEPVKDEPKKQEKGKGKKEKEIAPEESVDEKAAVSEIQEKLIQEEGLVAFASDVFEVVEKEEEKEEIVKENTPEEVALKSFQQEVISKLKTNNQQADLAKEPFSAKTTSPSVSEDYMKVANHKIDHLVDMISELIINQSLIEQYVSSNYTNDRQLVTNMSGFLRITRELQSLSMSLRMVSLKPTFQKLTRISRDTIQELKKDVEFVTSGEGVEIDRVVADKLLDPLVHMVKNAISHGIEEDSSDRTKIGKNKRARVELNAYSKRGKIFIEVKDDGRGINTEIVYQKALEKGLIDPNKTYSEAEIKEFIMMPGFSTAKVVDNISGRGVGMDVVKTQILKIGGKVDIQSTLNEGSVFTLEVPVNHAIMNGTIVEMNEQQFVVPTVNVKEFLQPKSEQWISTKGQRTMIKVRDNIIPIVPLSVFFKDIKEDENVPLVMIMELDQEMRAVPIVNVINRQEVVVKPVSEEFSHLKYISGMSILGTGKVSLILDIDYMFRKEIKE